MVRSHNTHLRGKGADRAPKDPILQGREPDFKCPGQRKVEPGATKTLTTSGGLSSTAVSLSMRTTAKKLTPQRAQRQRSEGLAG